MLLPIVVDHLHFVEKMMIMLSGVESPLTITLITTSDFLQMTSPIMKTEKTKPVSVLLPLC